jgi:hypothetical protein
VSSHPRNSIDTQVAINLISKKIGRRQLLSQFLLWFNITQLSWLLNGLNIMIVKWIQYIPVNSTNTYVFIESRENTIIESRENTI